MANAGHRYGLMAEFNDAETLVSAAKKVFADGYRNFDAFSPFPIEELPHAAGIHKTLLPLIVLAGGVLGCLGGYLMQYYASVIDYPLNIGGRPFHSWVSFIPVTFETTILSASLFAVFGMLALNGLPEPYHPVFNVPEFQLASRDRFFLCIEAKDRRFELEKTRRFLQSLNPVSVNDVSY